MGAGSSSVDRLASRPSYLGALFSRAAVIRDDARSAILYAGGSIDVEAWRASVGEVVSLVCSLAGEPAYYHKFPSDRSEAN